MYKEVLIKSINVWAANIIGGLLPSVQSPTLNRLNNIVGSFLGIDLSRYSILGELSFLVPELLEDTIGKYVEDTLNMLKISDNEIPNKFNTILDSCINRCKDKGSINIFGLQFEAKSFEKLKEIFNSYVSNTNVNVNGI
jgi:hypothetical protein